VELLDSPELDDEKFSNASGRLANAEELGEILDQVFESKKKQEMFYAAHQQRFIFGVIDSPEEVLDNPQFEARKYFVDLEHPEMGSIKFPGAPFLMSGTPWEARQAAPTLGQHSQEVLRDRLGYSEPEIAQLRTMEVI
jgi:crotonobetainyl-CoA:carnitine CoA-transferase CaiB-like acyl-CoA transferase